MHVENPNFISHMSKLHQWWLLLCSRTHRLHCVVLPWRIAVRSHEGTADSLVMRGRDFVSVIRGGLKSVANFGKVRLTFAIPPQKALNLFH